MGRRYSLSGDVAASICGEFDCATEVAETDLVPFVADLIEHSLAGYVGSRDSLPGPKRCAIGCLARHLRGE